MKMMKKTLMMVASVGALACMGLGATAISASAAEPATAPNVAVSIEQKAAIRKEGPMGIRFTANVENAAAITEHYGEENVVYGMLITPADYLTAGKTLAFDGGLTEWTSASGTGVDTYRNETAIPDANGYIYCSFVGIQENNYSRPFAARAYIGVRENTEAAFVYTYSDLCARSVYTVASYAAIDGETQYSTTVRDYFGGVLTKVQESYSTFQVDIDDIVSKGSGKVTATVSNGTKTLETGVALTSDNLVQEDLTHYMVKGFSESYSVTASVGRLTKTVEDLVCDTLRADISASAEADRDVYVTENGTATLTKVNAQGRENVLQWASTDTTCSTTKSTLNFRDPLSANIKKDVYFSFDIWTEKAIAPAWSAQQYFYGVDTEEEKEIIKFFDAEGYAIETDGFWSDSALLGNWITVELKIPQEIYTANSADYGLMMANTAWVGNLVYLDDIKVSSKAIVANVPVDYGTEGTILADEADLDNVYANNTTLTSITYAGDTVVGGRKGVFKWSTESETTVKGTDAMLRFKKTEANEAWLKSGSYLSFDMYMDETTPVSWFGAGTLLIYNYDGDDNTKVRVYDGDGFLITDKKIWNSSLLNTWITFEICLDEDYNFESENRGLSMYNEYGNFKKNGANLYLDNVKVSATQIVARDPATIGTEGTILADEKDWGNMYANNSTTTSFTYESAEIGGRTGTFKWSTESETNVNGTNAMLRFTNTVDERVVKERCLFKL